MTGRTLGPRLAAALVFVASGAVLVLEIVSLRLVAPYVGLTLETNSAVIGMALAAIAAGAWVGGRAADVVPPARLLGPLTLGGGALVLVVGPLVRWAGETVRGGEASGILLIGGIAVFAPAALLAAVTPVVVKLRLSTLAETGTVVGRLSGIGTLGAIAATFATGFVLVAMVPTTVILLALGGFLVLTGAALTVWLWGARPVAAPLVFALLAGGATVAAPSPCDVETAYHCARVTTDPLRPTGRVLELDTLRHSYVDLENPRVLEFAYLQGIASVTDAFRPAGAPVRALHIGGGGITLPRYLAATRPGTTSHVLEIDRGVLEIDADQLGFRPGANGITTRVVDGRIGVADEPTDSRDLVVGDAFGGIAVPWHLTTRELVADVRRVLADGGIYAVNVIDRPPLAFARAEVATIAAEFPHVALIARPEAVAGDDGGNFVVIASDRPLPVVDIISNLYDRGGVLIVSEDVAAFAGDARILTDDFAPVDQLLTPY